MQGSSGKFQMVTVVDCVTVDIFPFTDDRTGEQRHAILLCRLSSAAALC